MFIKKNFNHIKAFTLNFGPQHPAAHGVLRLILKLNGELVKRADAHIGLLHRGTEKLIEKKNFLQVLPYFDRLDYVSMMIQELAYALAIEQLLQLKVPVAAQITRVIFCEITRILNHLMAITTHALDIGAFSPFLWAFEEREFLLEIYERVSGARMHAAFIIPGGVSRILTNVICKDILIFTQQFKFRLIELEELLSANRIWNNRLKNVGKISNTQAINWSFSGVMLRSTGVPWDLRKTKPHDFYPKINFIVPISKIGDCFDRYRLRILEMYQSLNIINQGIFLHFNKKQDNKYTNFKNTIYLEKSKLFRTQKTMEGVINHFKFYSVNYQALSNNIFISIEAPKGEFGLSLITENSNKPYRCKIKTPGFFHLQGLDFMTRNQLLADTVAIIGTQDIVFGEIDR